MKKVLLVAVCALMLLGCEDASAKLKSGNDAVVTLGGSKVTKNQMYEILRTQDAGETAVTLAKNYILEKEIENTDEIETKAQEELASVKEALGENWELYLSYYGYASEEDCYQNDILPSVKEQFLLNKYVEEQWEDLKVYWYPTKVKMIETESADDANAALTEVKEGAEFETVAAKYTTKSDDLYDGAEHLVSRADQDTLPSMVISFLRENTSPTVSAVLNSNDLTKFYVVQVIACNPDQYKEEAVELISSQDDLSDEAMAYYFKKYNFHVYDISLLNDMKSNYPSYLNQ
ncbi:MAG: hypothetical protein HUJ58_08800 [Erysipelotrichaceae bacterium]|nr:hypothetical protein [Erysipelotrichaceae bacterium]